MTTKFLVCCVEEPSAQEMLKGILPRLGIPENSFKIIIFQGKQDLDRRLLNILKAWQQPNSVFLILRDQDSGDCQKLKQELLTKLKNSGKIGLVRIVCRALESFYLGDLKAVEQALKIPKLAQLQNNRKFRDPDRLNNPDQELIKLTKNNYQKVSGSRAISPYLDLTANKSYSFNILIAGITQITGLGAENEYSQ
ncbi:MAG: DUF4276 family protein [Snowella sp.]|nr:DUF4276 family protein [Snowella sp.]